MKHIVFAKSGIKIYFHPKNWNYAGGSFDFLNSCLSIIHHNPENQYYFLQSSDISELTIEEYQLMFPHNNVHFPYEDFNDPIKDEDVVFLEKKWQPFIWKWFQDRNINPDFGILDFGIYFNTNLINEIRTERGKHGEYAMPAIIAKRYATPIIHFINEWNGSWVSLHHDPRSDLKQRDIYNKPIFMASQCNTKYSYKTWNRKNQNFDISHYEQNYLGIQESALIGQTRKNINDILKEKTKEFGIVCNQSKDDRNSIDRTEIIKEYVLNNFNDDVEIYGKWDEEITKSDLRFCGVIPKRDLNDKIKSWKYSLCIPIGKEWATSKYLEMISNGIVPFLHPYYDSQKNIKIPHNILHVNSPKELKERIEYLNKNDNYEKLITKLYNHFMKDEYLSGYFINNRLMKLFDKDYQKEMNTSLIGFWDRFNKVRFENSLGDFL